MIHARPFAVIGLAALTVSLAAFAQAPVPSLRLQNAPAASALPPLTPDGSASAVSVVRGTGTSAGQPQVAGSGAAVRVPAGRDRFGNAVYGDKCSDSWVNCAYDPDRANPQLSRLPDQ